MGPTDTIGDWHQIERLNDIYNHDLCMRQLPPPSESLLLDLIRQRTSKRQAGSLRRCSNNRPDSMPYHVQDMIVMKEKWHVVAQHSRRPGKHIQF